MEPERGIKRVILSDGAIKHVVVEDAMGNERSLAAVDYISEGIQPPLETLPEVPARKSKKVQEDWLSTLGTGQRLLLPIRHDIADC
ncbi:Uncharacterised protein [Serratia fonticola]|uniref:Uncharacterized protein n=1 Tax=Serratia fonticola TaxID=47917 RepID=A0A4U9T636_SERFO|nr:Uncharacterised protein [Serratia fonticola]